MGELGPHEPLDAPARKVAPGPLPGSVAADQLDTLAATNAGQPPHPATGADGQRVRRTLVRTLRHELLDRTLIWNERQLRTLLDEYINHYNEHRPTAGSTNVPPTTISSWKSNQAERSNDTQPAPGLINEYRPAA